jgi:hypothetical protein
MMDLAALSVASLAIESSTGERAEAPRIAIVVSNDDEPSPDRRGHG